MPAYPFAMNQSARVIVVAMVGGVLSGCSSPWQEAYRPVPPLRDADVPPRETAVVRPVEWERLAEYRDAAYERRIARDTPLDEWSRQMLLEEQERFLAALRVDAPAENVALLGTSDITAAGGLDLFDPRLRVFAAETGADYAVVAEVFIGPRDTIEYAPQTAYFSDFRFRRGRGRDDFGSVTGSETVYVPVVVTRDTWRYVVYFLRVGTENEIRELTGGRPWIN